MFQTVPVVSAQPDNCVGGSLVDFSLQSPVQQNQFTSPSHQHFGTIYECAHQHTGHKANSPGLKAKP